MTVSMLIEKRFLLFPIASHAPKRWVTMSIAGCEDRQFEIPLEPVHPEHWMALDVGEFRGRHLTLGCDEGDELPGAVEQSDAVRGSQPLYGETYRPQFHFTARRGWINDPNGLLYDRDRGEYHLFFQHNPYGVSWGNMHWGHAVSRDLLHWEELPVALQPDRMGTMFSGSGVVDWRNTSGFGTGNSPPLVVIYTAAGDTSKLSGGQPFVQCLAYSNDGGRTWTKYAGNPVVPHIAGQNRDPKVIWHEPSNRWVMALYVDKHEYALLTSPDLKRWTPTFAIDLPGLGECPDLFPLRADGDPNREKWIFWGCKNGGYRIGSFDGAAFHPESEIRFMAAEGCHSYAHQTWSDIPAEDGRRIQISWALGKAIPGMPFNGHLTFPCELKLATTPEGLQLCPYPIREIEKLRGKSEHWQGVVLKDGHALHSAIETADIGIEVKLDPAGELVVSIRGTDLVYNAAGERLTFGGASATLRPADGVVTLRMLVDRTSVEIFGNEGRVYMPVQYFQDPDCRELRVYAREGAAAVSLDIYEMNSVWPRRNDLE